MNKPHFEEGIMETRPFGKTGESFPILSFGGQRIVDEHNCTEKTYSAHTQPKASLRRFLIE